jgi:hypothetical protein
VPDDKPYAPDDELIDEALAVLDGIPVRFPFGRSTFVKAMVAFGPLPKRGQRQFIDWLIKLYVLNQPVEIIHIPPSEVRDRLKNIETTAVKLLSLLLGINNKKMPMRCSNLCVAAKSRHPTVGVPLLPPPETRWQEWRGTAFRLRAQRGRRSQVTACKPGRARTQECRFLAFPD